MYSKFVHNEIENTNDELRFAANADFNFRLLARGVFTKGENNAY